MLGFIPDGYEHTGYIKAVPGLYDEVRFNYRPMVDEDVQSLGLSLSNLKGKEARTKESEAIAGRIISWSVKDPKGESVDPTAANIARLTPVLRATILNIIEGSHPNDPDPLEIAKQNTGSERLQEQEKN
jgi:hypothetical protein